MNITFLIGNGFDLNLDLHTLYTDFYPKYVETNETTANECIRKFCNMIKEEEEYENWGDFEWAFAKNVTGTHTEVGTILKNFVDLFSEYLQEQCEQLVYDTPEAKTKFYEFVVSPYKHLARADSQKIENFYNNHAHSQRHYKFVNFNYTDTLQNLLNQLQLSPRSVSHGGTYTDIKYNPLHIHGSLNERYMIIGIDALSQFSDESMRENSRLNRHCVKTEINKEYGYISKENDYKQIIDSSDIIYAYGIGFGETDRQRWNVLYKWLKATAEHKLVIFKHKSGFPELDGMNKGLLLDSIDDAKDEYLKLIGFEESAFERMHNQIFVADSESVLQFKLKRKERQVAEIC